MVIIHVPTRHFYSPYATKTTLLHLLPTSSKVWSTVQSTVTLVMDQSLVEIFGDLIIFNNPQGTQSWSNFGDTYQLPPGYVYNSEQANNLLAGQHKFLTTEIEVFN